MTREEPGRARRTTRKIVDPATHEREDQTAKIAPFTHGGPAGPPALPLRFGDWLVRRDLISRQDLYSALDCAYRKGGKYRVGDALVELGLLARDCVEQEARAFLNFTTFTVSLSADVPPADNDADAAYCSLDTALAAVTERSAPAVPPSETTRSRS